MKEEFIAPCLHWHQQIQQQQYMKLMVLNLSFSRLRLFKAGVSGQRRTASKIIFLIITLLYHLQWNKKDKLIDWLTSLPSRTNLSRTSLVSRTSHVFLLSERVVLLNESFRVSLNESFQTSLVKRVFPNESHFSTSLMCRTSLVFRRTRFLNEPRFKKEARFLNESRLLGRSSSHFIETIFSEAI